MKRNRKTLEHELKALIIDIIRRPQLSDLASELNALGFSVTPALAESFKAIVVRMATASASETPLAGLLLDLLESPFPSGALVNLLRYIDKTGAPDTFLNIVAGGKPVREILSTVFGTSQYMSDIIIRNPGYLYWLIEKQTWERRETRASYLEDLKCDVANFQTVASKLDAARRFQRRMLLKIGVQDLLGQQTIEETTSSLSHLADAIAENVLDVLWQNLPGAEVDTAPGLAVLALGKLGGGELNYSSDVDLIYLCEDTSDDKLVLYKDVAKRFTTVLSEVTAEGYLYRVDLRLRPDGDVGPLVNPFTSMMLYYENRARPWEFQAMLKARVIAGDCSVGKRFLGAISALMFNPTLSYSPVETIALMRNRIRQNMSLRDRSFNIKLMEGGIRDVEFIVQTLQLVHGHDYPELLVANTIDGVKAAHKRKLLKRIEKQTLLNAYRFFRLVEHRLQMMHQLKTHSIPESQEEIALLAARVSRGPMGTYSHHKFLSTLTKHLTKIRLVSDSFFGGVCISESTLLLLRPEDAALTRKTLSKFGLSDTAHALSTIQSLAHGSFPHLIDRGTRESFLRLLPLLLEELARTADPNRALLNFSKIAGATSNALTLYSMLLESRPLRALIRDMVGASPLLTGKLCSNMQVLDIILDDPEALLTTPLADTVWRASAENSGTRARGSDGERTQSTIDQRILAAWVVDIDRGTFPQGLSQVITRSVRELITVGFDTIVGESDGVVLFALGSFAVGEPRLTSDLDLLVITKGRELEPVTRAIQGISRILAEGNLLQIDFRLRGEGANAPLVQDLETYRQYFAKRLSPWERVAFAKCAHWWGDPSLAEEFTEAIMPRLVENPVPGTIESLIETRSKLQGLVKKDAELLETKRSQGGRYDIEYLCSIGLAVLGKPFSLEHSSRTRLKHLAKAGLITSDDHDTMTAALALYSKIEYLLELGELMLPSSPESTTETFQYLATTMELLGMSSNGDVESALGQYKELVRRCYDNFVSQLH